MNKLTQQLIECQHPGLVSGRDLAVFLHGSDNSRYGRVKRAIAAGQLLHIRRDLYCPVPIRDNKYPNPFMIAQHIYGPSYISLESALQWHGWLPEAVYGYTSVSYKVSKTFDTPLGLFSYRRVPQKVFYAGVHHKTDKNNNTFLIASPLKALADYVYVHKRDWASLEPAIENLRIEPEELEQLTGDDFDVVAENYNSRRVKQFCKGLRKDLGL